MAETNYLNLFKILIRKKGSTEAINFEHLYSYFNSNGKQTTNQIFVDIATKYVKSFNGEFKMGKNGKRALTAKSQFIKSKSAAQIIHGLVEGGITDADFYNYDRKNNGVIQNKINRQNVLSQPYYFLICMPKDTNVGIVILQTNDSVARGITGAFFDHLSSFLDTYGFAINKEQYTPKEISDKFYENSEVLSVDVIRLKNIDRFSNVVGELNNIRIKYSISGFKIQPQSFKDRFTKNGRITDELYGLMDLGADNSDKLVVKYSDGTTIRTASLDEESFKVRIDVDQQIKITLSDDSVDKMFNFAEYYLELAKKEIYNL